MYRLIYYSKIVDKKDITGQIDDIVAAASKVNHKLGITGFLVETNGTFIQVLEGERGDVLRLYFKIEMDPRHEDVRLIEYKQISKRKFPRWSMASSRIHDDEARDLEIFDKVLRAKDFALLEDMFLKVIRHA